MHATWSTYADNDWSMCCVQAQALKCYTDRFVALDHISYNLSGMTSTCNNDSKMSEKLCSHDCTCIAYPCSADGTCFLQDTPLVNSRNSPNFGGSFFLRVFGSDDTSPSRRTLKVPSIIGGGGAGFIFLLLLVSVWLVIKWRAAVFRASIETFSPGVVKFSYEELQKVTITSAKLLV
ncbi:hypothetical protein O6H91_Y223700 [Diphasiastrum complanatum]|nr:hypothetical protein O6H91_Y223700 [Diphasiastrum complanatum]